LLQSDESISEVIKVNIMAPMVLAKEYFRYCIGRGIVGNVVEFSSSIVTSRLRGESVYATTKAALEEMVKKQAMEIADFGLSICAVRLGLYNVGLGFGLNEHTNGVALRELNQKEYKSVDKLYSQLTSIMKMDSNLRNGMIFEIE
jgi:NAD(P)-dependent dehydrogenase (short-subunit alcohol dehydrogenase family)